MQDGADPSLWSVIPTHPELRCPGLHSENEEVDKKRAHFLEVPTGHQFPFKGTKDSGREEASWRLLHGGSRPAIFPLMGPSSPYYLNSPGRG